MAIFALCLGFRTHGVRLARGFRAAAPRSTLPMARRCSLRLSSEAPGALSLEVITDGLNDAQLNAVAAPVDSVSLVSAGPGSGKTRVLTHRVAWLLGTGVMPWQVLCVTFTNKAAREMQERLGALIDGEEAPAAGGGDFRDRTTAQRLSVGTFHSICARMLRSFAERVPPVDGIHLTGNFTIYTPAECLTELKKVAGDVGVAPPAERSEWTRLLNAVQKLKAAQLEQQLGGAAAAAAGQEGSGSFRDAELQKLVEPYSAALRRANAVDFDDLLLLSWKLLATDGEALRKLQDRWRHVLVDEWQDTNAPQYHIVRLLSGQRRAEGEPAPSFARSLFVVGDVDQSIYGWRGAVAENTKQLRRDFPSILSFELKENYRCVEEVTKVASAVIKRDGATRSALGSAGRPVRVLRVADDDQQAELVAKECAALLEGDDATATDAFLASRTPAAAAPPAAGTVSSDRLGAVSQQPSAGAAVAVQDEDHRDRWHPATVVAVTPKGGGRCVARVRFHDDGEEDAFELPDSEVRDLLPEGPAAPGAAGGAASDTSAWEMAVFYRTNAQSRALEAALRRHGVPYALQGSRGFFERKEVQDALAYLRLLANPSHAAAFSRAANYPPRGAGAQTLAAFLSWAQAQAPDATLLDCLAALLSEDDADALPPAQAKALAACGLKPRQRTALRPFAAIMGGLAAAAAKSTPAQLIGAACDAAGFDAQLRKDAKVQSELEERRRNLQELMVFADSLAEEDFPAPADALADAEPAAGGAGAGVEPAAAEAAAVGMDALRSFLTRVELASDAPEGDAEGDGEGDGRQQRSPVRLMTLHASKGLEFDAVWLTGAEEGSLPMTMGDSDSEEERRLFYVGVTRARRCLSILCRAETTVFEKGEKGSRQRPCKPSRFLADLRRLPPEVVRRVDATGYDWKDPEDLFDDDFSYGGAHSATAPAKKKKKVPAWVYKRRARK